MKKYFFIFILFFFIIFFLNTLVNMIFKLFISNNFNNFIKKINLENLDYSPGYKTTFYDFHLEVYDIGINDFSIQLIPSSLNIYNLNITGWKGKMKFKFKSGYDRVNYQDEITIFLKNIFLNYTLKVDYEPFKIKELYYSCKIYYTVKGEKWLSNNFINLGIKYYKDTINDKLGEFLRDFPGILSEKVNNSKNKYLVILKVIKLIEIIFYNRLIILLVFLILLPIVYFTK